MTICNMSIEAGARAGHDRARRDHLRLPRGPARRAARTGTRGRALAGAARATRTRRYDREVDVDVAALAPQVTWGTNPGHGRADHRPRARPGAATDDRTDERALALHGARAGHADRGHRDRPRLHRLVHQRAASRTCAPRRASSTAGTVAPTRARDGRARLDGRSRRRPSERASTASSRDAGFEWRERRLLDVPRHEPRHPAPGRALRLDLEPQLRGPPGPRRPHAPGVPEMAAAAAIAGHLVDVRELETDGAVRPPSPVARAPLDRANVDTDQIIPKQFLKRIERTGFGEFLFFDWRTATPTSCSTRPEFRTARRSSSPAPTSAAARRASTRPGRCRTAASARSSRRRSPTSSAPTAPRSACSASSCRRPTCGSCSRARRPRRPSTSSGRRSTLPSGRSVAFEIDPRTRANAAQRLGRHRAHLQREAEIAAYERTRERTGPDTVALGA